MMRNISQEKRLAVRRIIVDHVDVTKKTNMKSLDYANFKLYSGQSTGNKKEAGKKLLQEYLESSTIHGVKYLGVLRIKVSAIGKLFWALIMISSFLFSGWMIWKFWTRYNADPTRTIIEHFQAPVNMIPFPAITLCPLVAPSAETRKQLRQRFHLPHDMNNETAHFLIRYGAAFANEHSSGTKDYLANLKALLKINHMSLIDFLKYLRPCSNLFESCWWNGHKRNCSKVFKVSYTFTGICCSFNYLLEDYIKTGRTKNNSDFLRTSLFGPKSGLKVVLHRELFSHIDKKSVRVSTNSIGLVMFPHHPLEYVGSIAVRQILQAQQELWVIRLMIFLLLFKISVTPSIKKKPPGYYRTNSHGELTPYCADEGTKLKYFPRYRYSNCFTSCSIDAAVQLCGCVPYYYAPIADMYYLRICDWDDWECLSTNSNEIRIIENVKRDNFTCSCLTPCLNIFYEIQSSSFMLNNQQNFVVAPFYKNLSTNQSVLRVFLASETFMVMSTIPIADRLYLLASIGGIFSLFVGCSFISAIEIFYFIGLFLRSSNKTK